MTLEVQVRSDDDIRDNPADTVIKNSLSLTDTKSFFLFAGAGSGKTRSLEGVLESVAADIGDELRRAGRRIAVITYTNAACEEILRRVNNDPIFQINTIHSFAWSLIDGRNHDIRQWLLDVKLPNDLAKLAAEHAKGRSGTAAHAKREKKIASKTLRLAKLPDIHRFSYNPNGDNMGRDSLSHDEVISITADFLTSKEMFQKIVLSRYPFILIDESQDTLKPLMEAFLVFEKTHQGSIALGLFGDTMQRIYGHGLADLAERIPANWEKPVKVMNHRSRARIVELANSIRSDADQRKQTAREDRAGGYVHVFVAPSKGTDRMMFEQHASEHMQVLTNDEGWEDAANIKTLTLEWHMAASRLGFSGLFEPLDRVDRMKTSFRDGTLASMRLFSERVLPLVIADREQNSFALMVVLRQYSPLLLKNSLSASEHGAQTGLDRARTAVEHLLTLFANDNDPICADVLKAVAKSQLFEIPEVLQPLCSDAYDPAMDFDAPGDDRTVAWAQALKVCFSEVERYRNYVLDLSPYGTHQGVKGLEFPRVLVIADDELMRFKAATSYEKLFGAKDKSKNDLKNEDEGKETVIDRTRRLLYVTCTRAEESLALVVYSDNPKNVAESLVEKGWFLRDEITLKSNP